MSLNGALNGAFNAQAALASVNLPKRISRLADLVYNLWWTWHPEAQQLYIDLDPALWEEVNHNPVRLLSRVQSGPLARAAADTDYLARYDAVLADLDDAVIGPHPQQAFLARALGNGRDVRPGEEAGGGERAQGGGV